MKVKITGADLSDNTKWWYLNHIGETFEVAQHPNNPDYYVTHLPGRSYDFAIKKSDCEVVE